MKLPRSKAYETSTQFVCFCSVSLSQIMIIISRRLSMEQESKTNTNRHRHRHKHMIIKLKYKERVGNLFLFNSQWATSIKDRVGCRGAIVSTGQAEANRFYTFSAAKGLTSTSQHVAGIPNALVTSSIVLTIHLCSLFHRLKTQPSSSSQKQC